MINGAAALAEMVRTATGTGEPGMDRMLPVAAELSGLLPGRGLRRGSTVAVAGAQTFTGGRPNPGDRTFVGDRASPSDRTFAGDRVSSGDRTFAGDRVSTDPQMFVAPQEFAEGQPPGGSRMSTGRRSSVGGRVPAASEAAPGGRAFADERSAADGDAFADGQSSAASGRMSAGRRSSPRGGRGSADERAVADGRPSAVVERGFGDERAFGGGRSSAMGERGFGDERAFSGGPVGVGGRAFADERMGAGERGTSAGGGTSLMLALLAAASRSGSWCAVVGVPSLGALAAAESGIVLERIALVPDPGPDWPTVVAALIDGVDVVVVAVPGPVPAPIVSRLAARARQRGSVLVPFGEWSGADVTLQVGKGRWDGLGSGTGRLRRREVTVVARGRGAAARPREITMWMPGVTVRPFAIPPAAPRPDDSTSRRPARVLGDATGGSEGQRHVAGS